MDKVGRIYLPNTKQCLAVNVSTASNILIHRLPVTKVLLVFRTPLTMVRTTLSPKIA